MRLAKIGLGTSLLLVLLVTAAGYGQTSATTQQAPDGPTVEVPLRPSITLLFDKLIAGGTTVLVQLVVSLVGLTFAVERFISLRRSAIAPPRLFQTVDRLWSQGAIDEIDATCRRHPSTLARMVCAILAHHHSPVAEASTVAGDIGSRELRMHLQKAYPIAVVATIEPLLGLFGTVWGMILAFDKVAKMGSMGDAAALSAEISLALVTTAVGLAIAIPMLALYHYFKSRTSVLGLELEEQVNALLTRHLRRHPTEAGHADQPSR